MSDNVVGFEKKKKTFFRFIMTITYIDDSKEDIECTFFGTSVDNPHFMLFSNSHPNTDDDDESQVPDLLINTDNVKSIRKKSLEKVDW
ncbi:MAG: hypothetical protein H6961_07240 [Chromatiaceae bacterium]|nr:hypothetical protein [Chromatiaceae bacterium]